MYEFKLTAADRKRLVTAIDARRAKTAYSREIDMLGSARFAITASLGHSKDSFEIGAGELHWLAKALCHITAPASQKRITDALVAQYKAQQ